MQQHLCLLFLGVICLYFIIQFSLICVLLSPSGYSNIIGKGDFYLAPVIDNFQGLECMI